MTLSVVVCLAPDEVYYTMVTFSDIDPPGMFMTVQLLQVLTSVCDPLLIALGNQELRDLVRSKLTCSR